MLSVFKASYKNGIKLGQRGYAGNAYELTVIYYLKSEQAKKSKDNVAFMRPNFQEMADRLKMTRTPNVHFLIHSIEHYSEAEKLNVESITSQVALGKGVLLVPMKTNNAGYDLIHVAHERKLSVDEVKAAELNMPEFIPLRVTFLQLTVAEKQHSANFSDAHDVLARFKVKNVKIVEWLSVLDIDKRDFKLGPCSHALIDLESDEECDGESNEQASKTKKQKAKAKSEKSKALGCPKSDIRDIYWERGDLMDRGTLVRKLYSWCTYSCDFM